MHFTLHCRHLWICLRIDSDVCAGLYWRCERSGIGLERQVFTCWAIKDLHGVGSSSWPKRCGDDDKKPCLQLQMRGTRRFEAISQNHVNYGKHRNWTKTGGKFRKVGGKGGKFIFSEIGGIVWICAKIGEVRNLESMTKKDHQRLWADKTQNFVSEKANLNFFQRLWKTFTQ